LGKKNKAMKRVFSCFQLQLTKERAVGSIESKEFVTGDSLKAKKLRMTLSRRRRAKANTGGRPRLSYYNTLCAHQY
jgi:hypothetical protein